MQVRRLTDIGGVDVTGIDLASPRSPAEDRELLQLLDQHGLMCFRDQKLTKQQLFAAGAPWGGATLKRPSAVMDADAVGVATLGTRGSKGDVIPEDPDKLIGNSDWHTDDGFLTNPCRGKILYAVDVPEEGGMTGFIDGVTTYNELPEKLRKRVEGLHVIQDWNKSQAYMDNNRAYRNSGDEMVVLNKFPRMAYPIVRIHPITGAKSLNCPPLWATGIEELPGKEGEEIVEELVAHITQKKYQYWHKYKVGDAVLWDNWRFLHAAGGTLGRYVRTMWVITLNGGPTIAHEAGIAA